MKLYIYKTERRYDFCFHTEDSPFSVRVDVDADLYAKLVSAREQYEILQLRLLQLHNYGETEV